MSVVDMKPHPSLKYTAYTSHPWPAVQDWCERNIGEWNVEWYKLGEDAAAQVFNPGYKSTYLFRTEEQSIMFNLRWAG